MKNIYFTVGPSQLYPTVPRHIKTALEENILSLSHRSPAFQEIFNETSISLKKLLNIPKTHMIFFISSATEAMQLIISNCVVRKSTHFVNGAFSQRFADLALDLKKSPKIFTVPWGQGFDFTSYKIPKNNELICLTQNETSTGVAIPPSEIHVLKKRYPKQLMVVDIVSSAPIAALDYHLVDCAFFSVQKGFGLPAGLGVLIVNQKVLEKAAFLEKRGLTGGYHKFSELLKYAQKSQTPETPNVLDIYLLDRVCKDMLSQGINKIRQENQVRAKLLYDYFSKNPRYKFFVNETVNRSSTTLTIEVQNGSQSLIGVLQKRHIIVSSGYKKLKETHIRIANYPAHSQSHIYKLLTSFSSVAK